MTIDPTIYCSDGSGTKRGTTLQIPNKILSIVNTGGPLIGREKGSIVLTNHLMKKVKKIPK